MSLRKMLKRVARPLGRVAGKVIQLSPAGRIAGGLFSSGRAIKGIAAVGGVGAIGGAVAARARGWFGGKRRRRSKKGITTQEMQKLMVLQMFVQKGSPVYQMAVMKAFFGKI